MKASDDAAGSAMAASLSSDISSLETVAQTVQQVNSLLQIADGGLQRVGDILQRMKSLGTQYASGTLSATEKGFINDEYAELGNELDLIKSSVTFNGDQLLDGAFDADAVFGVNATSDTFDLDLTTGTVGANTTDVDIAGLNLPAATGFTDGGIATEIGQVDTAINNIG